ncbi:MAG: carboxypeptidase regulatory-like domain-containing protein [Acidobacteriaceae bacterium]|nr:carboxypeptidase regulatory-like domain-containing protein [Acidobacteriaceae bacterium]
MNVAQGKQNRGIRRFLTTFTIFLAAGMFTSGLVLAQTASTGALAGNVLDPTGAAVPGASVKATNVGTADSQTVVSEADGSFLVPLLPPGTYDLAVTKPGFKTAVRAGIHVHVTDTERTSVNLEVGDVTQTVEVTGQGEALNTQDTALGHVTNQQAVEGLPLVNRNYTQILGLSPGVVGPVDDASALGQGGSSFNAGISGVSAHGGATNDNNFQMNGVEVNDLMASGHFSGGVPVPNPDAIQEFKVQTGQYDASYGRNAGANVDVLTKSGTNAFHGNVFEFVRNDIFNANDFFLNEQGQKKGALKQNQFGFTLGGPIKNDKLLFFTSYQGTRQVNGLDTSAACLSSFTTPPQLALTGGGRSAGAIGAAFAGQASAFLPEAVAADGSNLSPQAVALLNTKLANGNYLIPSPQNAATGLTSVTQNCSFNDDQFVTNLDYLQSSKMTWSGRFFWDDNSRVATLPSAVGPTLPGFPQPSNSGFRDASVTNTYAFAPNLVNQIVLGYNRLNTALQQGEPTVTTAGASGSAPFSYAGIGATAPGADNTYPAIVVLGSFALGGNGQGLTLVQNSYNAENSLSWVHGKHSLRLGGGASYKQINFTGFHFAGFTIFPSFADLLLGNVLESEDFVGLSDRAWRAWNGDAYIQDDFRVTSRLTLNLGVRYEHQGPIGDALGRPSILNLDLVDPNPPTTGTLAGYTVASNFKGTIPAGVTRGGSNTALYDTGETNVAPRVGFAWQPSGLDRFVIRSGYGMFFTRTTGQPFLQLLANPPYGLIRTQIAVPLSDAFPAAPASIPFFPAYSPSTALTPTTFSPNLRPPIVQEYSFNVQARLAGNLVLEAGYEGARGTHLLDDRYFDQALSASPSNPVRGATDNSAATLLQRTPYQGFLPAGVNIIESEGSNWYNAMEVSLNKRFSHGLQFLASYTWQKDLTADNAYAASANGGVLVGDQNNAQSRYGPDQFVRPQRFVFSFLYNLPGPRDLHSLLGRVLGDWSVSGVVTIQSGDNMSILVSNTANAFGLVSNQQDRAQIAPGCSGSQLVTPGSLTSKLNNYFNASCFTGAPVVAADGSTGFGNSGTGLLLGPGQYNVDLAVMKRISLREKFNLQLRGEFFNAFNTPQFNDPNTNAGTVVANPGGTYGTLVPNPTFGLISSTSVNPRVIQLAAKLTF